MYLNVSQLMREPGGSRRSHQVDEELGPLPDTDVTHVRGTVNLLRTDKSIWVSALLDSDTECVCSRCLDSYRQQIRMEIEEEYFPSPGGEGWDQSVTPEHPGECFFIDSGNTLDLTEAVRQYATISVPMKPVCREDCAGICAKCGVNLNHVTCSCAKTLPDPRWGPLLRSDGTSLMVSSDNLSDAIG